MAFFFENWGGGLLWCGPLKLRKGRGGKLGSCVNKLTKLHIRPLIPTTYLK